MPNLKDRYDLDEKCNLTIQDYVSHAQIYFDSILENRCYQILDYLYTVVKNDAETANDYLQVQKMDLRHATKTMLNDHMVVLEPQITGEAAKLVKNNEKTNEYEIRLLEKITKCGEAISSGENDLDIIVETIDVVLNFMKASKLAFKYQKILISLIANALKKEELEKQKREMFCNIWLDGIQELFCNGSFLADTALVSIFLNQLNSDVNISIKNKIKKMILNCLMHEGDHGIIAEMTRYVKSFLSANQQIAQLMFNTIIMLAEYEGKDKKGRECKDFIIETYLFNEQSVEIQEFDMSKYDIGIICHAVKCGLSFEHGFFKELVHQILVYVIDFRKANEENYGSIDVIDVYQEYDITELYMSEMVQANNDAKEVIDTLFDGIDFTKFTSDMIEFYQNIFGNFVCEFFNAYIDPQRRNRCKRKILYIESRINEISNEKVRVELYKVLIFAINSYCSGDWSSLKTEYTYADKVFLNEQFTKYGSYHIMDLLKTIYQLQMNKLLPEILISINNSFKIAKNNSLDTFRRNIEKENIIVKIIILKAFLMYSDMIKQDDELTEAYENILKVLIELNYEEAAVLLDEFRVH